MSLSQRYKRWGRTLYSMRMETLLAPEKSAQGITVKKETTLHPDARTGLFDFQIMEKTR